MNFNWKIYKELNNDLENFGLKTKKDYETHYLQHGQNKRPYLINQVYPDFNPVIYKNNYNDLKNLSNSDLELHWLMYGKKNNRIYNRNIKKKVYIVFTIKVGGSIKYINNLINNFNTDFTFIDTKSKLYKTQFSVNDIVLVQQLIQTDIEIYDLIQIKKKYNIQLFICIHDFCWLHSKSICQHRTYLQNNQIMPEIKLLFTLATTVIHPTQFTYDEYSKKMDNKNFKIIPHPDYNCDVGRIFVPKVNGVINIGVFHIRTDVKGSEYVDMLKNTYRAFGNNIIQYFIVDVTINRYIEEEYFIMLSKYNIHGLLLLNKWGETWSYLLTKSLMSGLPILYNNIGSYKYRIKEMENKFSVGEKDGDIDLCKLWTEYDKMLNYIVKQGITGKNIGSYNNEIIKPQFYIDLLEA
jgi:hypothetical protein